MVLAAVAAWVSFAPKQIGGSVSYVLTNGNSMEPNLHAGDLVMVRQQLSYRGGDVVAYRNQDLGGAIVLHRIVGIDEGRFVFKGDNNDFIDPYHPNRSELVGKLWLRIPSGGKYLDMIREPRNAALLGGLLALMVFGGSTAKRKRRSVAQGAGGTGGPSPTVPVIAGVGLLLFALLGTYAFLHDETEPSTAKVPYKETGTFSYSAPAPKGPVYQHSIQTGDPVFLKLVSSLNVRFGYKFEVEGSHDVAGRASLVAVVSQQNGWKREIPMVAAQTFSGDTATVSGTLNLERLRRTLNEMQRLTGQEADIYSVEIAPSIDVSGNIQGTDFSDTFEPSLSLQLTTTTLGMPPTDEGEGSDVQASSSREGSVLVPTMQDDELRLGPLHTSIANARMVGLIGGIASLVLLIAFGIPLMGAYRRDEATRINARYGPLLVPMRSVSGINGALAEVDDMEALVRIADRYDRLVLHEQHDGVHRYYVEGDGVVYFYKTEEEASA